jgi:plasmid stabilization system protein ParE
VKVILSLEARDDLTQIGDHIAETNLNRARSFVRELVEAADGIGRMPRAFQQVPRYARLGVRRRVHGAYLIFYRVDQGGVSILRILHGARDYERLLFPDD